MNSTILAKSLFNNNTNNMCKGGFQLQVLAGNMLTLK